MQDANDAAILLPPTGNVPSTPTKVAANALLARIYLYLQDYPRAVQYANACLREKSDLLDFETLNAASNSPIARFNKEVIFQAIAVGSATYTRTRWKVDSTLMEKYDDADLRKAVFFIKNGDGTYSYKGNYDGQLNQAPFSGPAVDEILISRAEGYLRTGKVDSALMDLNMLRRSRWVKSQFTPITEKDPQKLLDIILMERRKELIMRQRRWPDLKRLNLDPSTAQALYRNIENKEYVLPPNDARYTMLIPLAVLENSTLQQTKR
ncbi:SusD family protein [compost metagenome]